MRSDICLPLLYPFLIQYRLMSHFYRIIDSNFYGDIFLCISHSSFNVSVLTAVFLNQPALLVILSLLLSLVLEENLTLNISDTYFYRQDVLIVSLLHTRVTHPCLTAFFPGQPGTAAEMIEWQWHQLDHMQVTSTLLHASTSSLSFLTGQMLFLPPIQQRQSTEGHCCSTNRVKTLKEGQSMDLNKWSGLILCSSSTSACREEALVHLCLSTLVGFIAV